MRHGMGCCSPAVIEPHFPAVGTSYEGRDGVNAGVREVATTVTFSDEHNQPWRTIQIWLELRHDLAAVALLQVRRKKGAVFYGTLVGAVCLRIVLERPHTKMPRYLELATIRGNERIVQLVSKASGLGCTRFGISTTRKSAAVRPTERRHTKK